MDIHVFPEVLPGLLVLTKLAVDAPVLAVWSILKLFPRTSPPTSNDPIMDVAPVKEVVPTTINPNPVTPALLTPIRAALADTVAIPLIAAQVDEDVEEATPAIAAPSAVLLLPTTP